MKLESFKIIQDGLEQSLKTEQVQPPRPDFSADELKHLSAFERLFIATGSPSAQDVSNLKAKSATAIRLAGKIKPPINGPANAA